LRTAVSAASRWLKKSTVPRGVTAHEHVPGQRVADALTLSALARQLRAREQLRRRPRAA
jgi:hypothetical protein